MELKDRDSRGNSDFIQKSLSPTWQASLYIENHIGTDIAHTWRKKRAEICVKNLLELSSYVEQIVTVTEVSLSKAKKPRYNL